MKAFLMLALVPVMVVAGEAQLRFGDDGGAAASPGQGRLRSEGGTMCGGGMMGQGMMGGGMMGGGMMGGMMGGPEDMPAIHRLLMNHRAIERTVEDIPRGVRTLTTSRDPQVAVLIREHVWAMKKRIDEGRPTRQMDPLFREIFRNHSHIRMEIEDVPSGVRVTETSDEPQVTLLIRQHARRAVSEFVEEGMPRAMRPTPLPEGYTPPEGEAPRIRNCCS